MDRKKRNIIIGSVIAGVVAISVGIIVASGLVRKFDPKDYVEAVLEQTLKGDVKAASQLMAGATTETLEEQYEAGIKSFVKNSIAGGIELDEELEGKYVELCKKVFASMKYEIKDAKKTNKGYEVTVNYQPSNIFENFITKIGEENARLLEKVENGEYRGTLEEINSQMQKDFMNNAYALFEECLKQAEYAEKEEFVFAVEKDEKGMHGVQESQISDFIKKIMKLDEIQG